MNFGRVWEQVAGPAGQTLSKEGGTGNRILSVDGCGVLRITSEGTKQRLETEIFRWTVERLLAGETLTRHENQRYVKRGSSGVVLILGSLPTFETTKVGGKLALRIARGRR